MDAGWRSSSWLTADVINQSESDDLASQVVNGETDESAMLASYSLTETIFDQHRPFDHHLRHNHRQHPRLHGRLSSPPTVSTSVSLTQKFTFPGAISLVQYIYTRPSFL